MNKKLALSTIVVLALLVILTFAASCVFKKLPDDPDIASHIENQGGIDAYCREIQRDAPTRDVYESLFGMGFLFGARAGQLTHDQTFALGQWTFDNCY